MGPGSVRGLEVWQEGMDLVKTLYFLTRAWPKEELYRLTSQVRRAVISIPANLAEGVGRGTPAEKARFGHIALGSAYELDTLLVIALELEFSKRQDLESVQVKLNQLCKRLSGFIRYQETQK